MKPVGPLCDAGQPAGDDEIAEQPTQKEVSVAGLEGRDFARKGDAGGSGLDALAVAEERRPAVAADERKVRNCRFCWLEIDSRASVCYHCQRNLKRKPAVLEVVGLLNVLVTIGLLALGTFQYLAARDDKRAASTALEQTTRNAVKMEKLLNEQGLLRSEINSSFRDLFSDVCDSAGGVFDFSSLTCRLRGKAAIRYRGFPVNQSDSVQKQP